MGSWVKITEQDFLDRSNEAERDGFEEQDASGNILSDKLCGIIAQVIAEVRGRIASCHRNTDFGAAGTIPPECKFHAVSLIRHAFTTTTGATRVLQGGDRDAEYENASRYFDRVADCKEVISPDSGATGDSPTRIAYGSNTKLNFAV